MQPWNIKSRTRILSQEVLMKPQIPPLKELGPETEKMVTLMTVWFDRLEESCSNYRGNFREYGWLHILTDDAARGIISYQLTNYGVDEHTEYGGKTQSHCLSIDADMDRLIAA